MLAWRAVAFVLALLVGGTANAQPPTISLPDGRTVEVLGLRRWSLEMIQDSLEKYSPGDSLQSHACAATLRYKLGFADASSWAFVYGGDTASRLVVAVREPQDSARVRFNSRPLDTSRARASWRSITSTIGERPWVFQTAVDAYLWFGDARDRPRPLPTRADSVDAAAVRRFLRAHRSIADRRLALRVLSTSSNVNDRALAAGILGSFPRSDEAWRSLVEALRESDGTAKTVAASVLSVMTQRHARAINWRPAHEALHAMLDGTSLFALPTLLHVLPMTGVGPADAGPLLRDGGEILLAFLTSRQQLFSEPSRTLLTRLRGADLGPAPEPWRAWIASL